MGDEIVKVTLNDGTYFIPETFEEIMAHTQANPQERVILSVQRAGTVTDYVLTPELQRDGETYLLGIQATPSIVDIHWDEAFKYGTLSMVDSMSQIVSAIANLLRGVGLEDMSGPVGIFQATSQVTQSGFAALLTWLGLLSLNIGIFNLLPLPILDGGRIVIVLLEKLIGKKFGERLETAIMLIGVALVFGLMIYVTWNDILRFFR